MKRLFLICATILVGIPFSLSGQAKVDKTKDSFGNEYVLDYCCDFDFPVEEMDDWFLKQEDTVYEDSVGYWGKDRLCPNTSSVSTVRWHETDETYSIENGVLNSYLQLKWSPSLNDKNKKVVDYYECANLANYCGYYGNDIPLKGYKFSKNAVIEAKIKFVKNTSISNEFWIRTTLPFTPEFTNGAGATKNTKGYYINEIDFMELTWDGRNRVKPRGGMFILSDSGESNYSGIDNCVSTIKINPDTWFDEWHVVRAEWTDEDIKCYLDDTLYEVISWNKEKYGDTMDEFQIQIGAIPQVSAFQLPDFKIGKELSGETEKYKYSIDYIKVYKEVK